MKLQVNTRGYGIGNSPSIIQHMYGTSGRGGAYLMYDKYDESWSCEASFGSSYDVSRVR